MLPPDLAAFAFSLDLAGSDEALAARAADAVRGQPGTRIAILGAQRWGLLAALARALDGTGVEIVALDSSRTALAAVQRALEIADAAGSVTLLAADPRDLDLPGGADAFLIPSGAWRTIVQAAGRASSLACIRRALRPGGALLLDLDRTPGGPPETEALLREGPGRQRWTWRRAVAPGAATVRCASPGVPVLEIDLAVLSPEEAAEEVRAAGFRIESAGGVASAASSAPATPASARLWLVARAGNSAT